MIALFPAFFVVLGAVMVTLGAVVVGWLFTHTDAGSPEARAVFAATFGGAALIGGLWLIDVARAALPVLPVLP